jgi:malate dehydrogenase
VGVIGAGDIGLNLVEILALHGFDTIIYNRYHEVEGGPSPYWLQKLGRIMDINDSLQFDHCGSVTLTSDLNHLHACKYIIITAGAKRSSPEETREQLAKKNAKIIKDLVEFLANNLTSLVLLVTNPVDCLTQCLIYEMAAFTGRSREEIAQKIVGVSLIDSLRLKNIVKESFKLRNISLIRPKIEAISVGEHGPTMVPVMSKLQVNGQAIYDFLPPEDIEYIRQHTIARGNDIIRLTGTSSVFGPSHAVLNMVLLLDQHKEINIPSSVWDGKRVIGNLAHFADNSFTKLIPLELDEIEKSMLLKSQEQLDKQFTSIYNNGYY